MKHLFILMLWFLALALQAQTSDAPITEHKDLTLLQLLGGKGSEEETEVVLTTKERAIQMHDGMKVYHTEREAQYIFKATAKKVTRKRKVLSSSDGESVVENVVVQIYPDMTGTLLSSVLSPTTIQKKGEKTVMPCILSHTGGQEKLTIVLDKLAMMKSCGLTTADCAFGVCWEFEKMTERLDYASLADSTILKNLSGVQTIVELKVMEQSGQFHQVEVREDICVLSAIVR